MMEMVTDHSKSRVDGYVFRRKDHCVTIHEYYGNITPCYTNRDLDWGTCLTEPSNNMMSCNDGFSICSSLSNCKAFC